MGRWHDPNESTMFRWAQQVFQLNPHWALVAGASIWLVGVAGYGWLRASGEWKGALVLGGVLNVFWFLLLIASLVWWSTVVFATPELQYLNHRWF